MVSEENLVELLSSDKPNLTRIHKNPASAKSLTRRGAEGEEGQARLKQTRVTAALASRLLASGSDAPATACFHR